MTGPEPIRPPALAGGARAARLSRRGVVAGLGALALGGCAGAPRNPVPQTLLDAADVPGYGRIRFWGDDASSIGREAILAEAGQSRARTDTPDWFFLSISGGGSNGAFGAGLITGWTETGSRPEFDIVTGVSTGSLTAPFAFLGPAYDAELTAAYTQISREDVATPLDLFGILSLGAAESDAPLRRLIDGYVTDAMTAEIAAQHRLGRRLLVGTTNLDADRPVVWDIGAIADSAVPTRRELIRDVLVASSSIPGVFPPARIAVVADGVAYDELHVDGGATHEAFLFPANFTANDLDLWTDGARRRSAYVIRNGKVSPQYAVVKASLPAVVQRSVNSLVRTQGVGDLYQMYENARRLGVDFNAIWIPASFTMVEPKPFDQGYMRAVYALGRQMAAGGIPWSSQPPE
jgi:hypothetical protein